MIFGGRMRFGRAISSVDLADQGGVAPQIDAGLGATFELLMRELEVAAGWQIRFIPSGTENRWTTGGGPDDASIGDGVSLWAVALDTGDPVGVLVCRALDGEPLGFKGKQILRALARVVGSELDAIVAHRQVWDSERCAVQTLIDDRRVRVVFQPIVDLRSMDSVAVEALARFEQNPPNPGGWFARAGRVGLGLELEFLAAQRAIELLGTLPADVALAVNASPTLICDSRFQALLEVDPGRMIVEISETSPIMPDSPVPKCLTEIRARGIRLAVDDAGAGYAGFERLVRLRPDIVKLDLALIRGIDTDPARAALTAGLVGFCRSTGALLLAEGIETQSELDRLVDLGVDLGQGFFIARPCSLPLPTVTSRPRRWRRDSNQDH